MKADFRTLADEFMKDWCAFGNVNRDPRDGCERNAFLSWECCEFHRNSDAQLKALTERANVLMPMDVGPMCALWAVTLCERAGLDFMSYNLQPWLRDIGGRLWIERAHRVETNG